MPTSQPFFVALVPGPELHQRIQHAKSTIVAIAGNQLYVSDPPHLTVFLALFQDRKGIVGRLDSLRKGLQLPTVTILGWNVFEKDCLTGNNTLVCKIEPEVQKTLRGIQTRVLSELAPLRDRNASLDRYRPNWTNLSKERRTAVETFGFPFVGEDWLPHFTIASIESSVWQPCWEALEHQPITGSFDGMELVLYELIDRIPHRVH